MLDTVLPWWHPSPHGPEMQDKGICIRSMGPWQHVWQDPLAIIKGHTQGPMLHQLSLGNGGPSPWGRGLKC
jgi:hypothetical protein